MAWGPCRPTVQRWFTPGKLAAGSLAAAPWPTWAATTWTCPFGPSNLARPRLSRPTRFKPHIPWARPKISTAADVRPPRARVGLSLVGSSRRPDCLSTVVRQWQPVDWNSGVLFVGRAAWSWPTGRHYLLRASVRGLHSAATKHPQFIGHHREWLEAIRTGGPTTCHFALAAT